MYHLRACRCRIFEVVKVTAVVGCVFIGIEEVRLKKEARRGEAEQEGMTWKCQGHELWFGFLREARRGEVYLSSHLHTTLCNIHLMSTLLA